ncbi:tyrosine-type recombinase/integrase [[Mycobacterium] zoologicum]|uniref:tyrosine-type recombinase/integrase n=1 Tax=[Mycobacterium] zoologicum TaxID=2872311 RepID=UPI001CDACB18|nr:tyrosine-type recombinase/integrase [Mycolicibacter sp. MYC101]MEB3062468.1 tyrosine-type recombinase/integrase [Mycolicibacter sp. MYC101]
MPRQRMRPGEYGKITDRVVRQELPNGKAREIFYATTYLRLHSGKLREREASSGKSAEDARRELKRRIADELEAGEPTGVIDRTTTLSELFAAWLPAKIAEDRIGERTVTLYRDTWRLHGEPWGGDLRIAELTTSRADAHLKALPSSAAIYLRIILSGMYSLAARFDVVKHNPIRETKTAKQERKPARALTGIELEQVRRAVEVWCGRKGPGPRRGLMLPVFVELLAATGVRPGEVLAIEWDEVDLLAVPPTVTVSGTVQDAGRVAGKPLHRQDRRKGDAPPHTVTLPKFGAQVLTDLYAVTGPTGTVLKNRDGGLVSLSNIRSSLREALAPHEDLRWVTPHSFRRSVATVVRDGLGVEAAQQQLSHAQLATTEGHYVQRVTAGPDTRAVLEEWASKGTG